MDSEIQVIHDAFGRVFNSLGVECITVRRFAMRNIKTRMTASVTTYGASILSIRVRGDDGTVKEVVAGFDTYEGYRDQRNTYIGATIGRIAGGIRCAHFIHSMSKREHKLTRNFIGHHWNGGFYGLDKRHWDIYKVLKNGVCFAYSSPAWEEGYPNKVYFKAIYKLTADNTLDLTYLATFAEPSVVNMTNHTYFNLAGHDAGTEALLDHFVTINADNLLETYKKLPTGNVVPVRQTIYDLREGDCLRHRINWIGGFDNYWAMDRQFRRSVLAPMARIIHKGSGRILTVFSNKPVLYFYTATDFPVYDKETNKEPVKGRGNTTYLPNSLFCAMPQSYPDAPHNPNFPTIELEASDTYRHRILYEFSTLKEQAPLRVVEDLPEYDYLIDPQWTFTQFLDKVANKQTHGFIRILPTGEVRMSCETNDPIVITEGMPIDCLRPAPSSIPLSSGAIPPNNILEFQTRLRHEKHPMAFRSRRISIISEEDSSAEMSASIPTPQEVITPTTTCMDRPPDEMAPKPPSFEPPPRPPKTKEIKKMNTEVVRKPSEGPLVLRYSERGASNELPPRPPKSKEQKPAPATLKVNERMESEEVPTTSQSLRASANITGRDSDAFPPRPPKSDRIRALSEPKDENQSKQQVQTTKYTGTIPKTSAGRSEPTVYETVYGGKVLREIVDSVDTLASRFMATTISKDYSNRYKSPEERSNIPRSISGTRPISAPPEAVERMSTQGPLIPSAIIIPMQITTADELPITSAAAMQATRMTEFPTTSRQETSVTNVRGKFGNKNRGPRPVSELIPTNTPVDIKHKYKARFYPITKSLVIEKWNNIRTKISQRKQTQSSLNTKETRNYNRLTSKSTGSSEATVRTNTRRSPKKKTDSSSPYKRMPEPSPSDSVDTVVQTNVRTSPKDAIKDTKKKFSPGKLVNKAVKKFGFSKSSSASSSQSYLRPKASQSLDMLLQEDTGPKETKDSKTSDYGNENEDESESEIKDKK